VDAEVTTLIAGEVADDVGAASSAVAGASDDLSHLYFVSKEDLADGATAGERNLYLDREGEFSFIATLSKLDLGGTGDPSEEASGVAGWWATQRSSRVTSDGRHLAFMSNRSLTGYDNRDAKNGKPTMEVFVYDAETEQLTCASCNPSGARPVSQRLRQPYQFRDDVFYFGNDLLAAAWLPTSEDSLHTPRALSEDGSHLFFNSYDALLPRDTNGAMDVYQWEAQGSGDCTKANGCISLISSGTNATKSEFVEASPDGEDVFFKTESSLVPQDPGLIDVYDARVNGGFPTPSGPGPCIGDSCQSPPAPPNDPTPASAAFRGAGDPKPRNARRRCRARARAAAKRGGKQGKKAKRCSRAKRGGKR
jgi:hypothetical protein